MLDAISKAMSEAESSYHAATKAVASRASQSLVAGPSGGLQSFPSYSRAAEQYKHNAGWTYCCVKAVAQKLAGQDIHVGRLARKPTRRKVALPRCFKSIGDSVEPLSSHPILDLLNDPAPILTRWTLLFSAAANLLVTGRSFLWLPEEKGRRECWPIPTSWVKPLDYTAVHAETNGLLCAARKYLGSWQNALRAAGIEPKRRSGGRRAQ